MSAPPNRRECLTDMDIETPVRAGKMVSAVKCLSRKYEDQEKAGTMAYTYNPSPGKEEDRTHGACWPSSLAQGARPRSSEILLKRQGGE